MGKYILFNNDVVYHKGYMYFGFNGSNGDDYEGYDNVESAKQARRKLKKEDTEFGIVQHDVLKKENWQIAYVNTITTLQLVK